MTPTSNSHPSDSPKINWRRALTDEVAAIKTGCITALSFIWFGQDVPRVIALLPKNWQELLPETAWIRTALKPYEAVAVFIKQVGTLCEMPDKWHFSEFKKEENRWRRWNKVAVTLHVTIDGLFLIPHSWKMLDLGRWASFIGMTPFGIERIKEGVTIWASFCNAKAAAQDRDKVVSVIDNYKQRLDPQAPLAQLKALFDQAITPQTLQAIDCLKAQRSSKPERLKQLKRDVADLEKERDKLRALAIDPNAQRSHKLKEVEEKLSAKREKAVRIKLWSQQATPERLADLKQVVVYKCNKYQTQIVNAERTRDKLSAGRWYDISKVVVLIFHNLLQLGLALVLAPHLGLSSVTISGLFLLGRWITSLTTGICSARKMALAIQYKEPLPLPQTNLVRV